MASKRLSLMFLLLCMQQTNYANARTAPDYKQLVSYIKQGQVSLLRQALQGKAREDINLSGRVVLISSAISNQQPDAIDALVDWGIDVNRTLPQREGNESFTTTPLLYAISGKAGLPVVERLVKRGADVNKASESLLPLNFALSLRQYEVASFLLDKGANPNGVDGLSQMTPLIELIISAQEADGAEPLTIAKRLLKTGASIEARPIRGSTPLGFAVLGGKIEMVRFLLEQGANPNAKNAKGESLLIVASRKQREDIAALLRQYGAKP